MFAIFLCVIASFPKLRNKTHLTGNQTPKDKPQCSRRNANKREKTQTAIKNSLGIFFTILSSLCLFIVHRVCDYNVGGSDTSRPSLSSYFVTEILWCAGRRPEGAAVIDSDQSALFVKNKLIESR